MLYLFHVYQYSRFRNENLNHARITCLLNNLTYTATNLFCFEIKYTENKIHTKKIHSTGTAYTQALLDG